MKKAVDAKEFEICIESEDPIKLNQAYSIWGKNRKTLGLLPRGAFEEYANKNWIIYLLKENKVVGYLLYRMAKQRAAIAHLCIDKEHRGCNGARVLLSSLIDQIKDGYNRGIEVRCRADYSINLMWPRLNFEHVKNTIGRAKSGSELCIWFYPFDTHGFYYDMLPKVTDDDLIWAVLDANIVYKYQSQGEDGQESMALFSDSISSYSRYFVTPEIYTEIERKKDKEEKEKSRLKANKFEKTDVRRLEYEKYQDLITPIWGSVKKDRDRSDLNHIAYTAAMGIQYFLTNDTGILAKKDEIFSICNVDVLRPVEFVIKIDQAENSEKYSPQAIARTPYQVRSPLPEEVSEIANNFVIPSKNEKTKTLAAKLRSALANQPQYKVLLATSPYGHSALVCFNNIGSLIKVEIMRHSPDTTSKTILLNLLWHEIASEEGVSSIVYCDPFQLENNQALLKAFNGTPLQDKYIRISLKRICTKQIAHQEISKFIKNPEFSPYEKELSTFIDDIYEHRSDVFYEENFWPLKLVDAEIPTYLIPIKPAWALNLFDKSLADQDLFGANPIKHFNIENVYYRSTKPKVNIAPGSRILWYVSSGDGFNLSEIRACSRVISSETISAKQAYQKFKRLGIYQWKDIMSITDYNMEKEVMALRFFQTECFKNPVPLENFKDFGINMQPFSPKKVEANVFENIYRHGIFEK